MDTTKDLIKQYEAWSEKKKAGIEKFKKDFVKEIIGLIKKLSPSGDISINGYIEENDAPSVAIKDKKGGCDLSQITSLRVTEDWEGKPTFTFCAVGDKTWEQIDALYLEADELCELAEELLEIIEAVDDGEYTVDDGDIISE